jgi:hypothetical protein
MAHKRSVGTRRCTVIRTTRFVGPLNVAGPFAQFSRWWLPAGLATRTRNEFTLSAAEILRGIGLRSTAGPSRVALPSGRWRARRGQPRRWAAEDLPPRRPSSDHPSPLRYPAPARMKPRGTGVTPVVAKRVAYFLPLPLVNRRTISCPSGPVPSTPFHEESSTIVDHGQNCHTRRRACRRRT